MNTRHLLSPVSLPGRPRPARGQRGVVMFIALLVMVALSLAGIALIRSADTATVVSGNLAFKQAAVYAVDRSIEQAVKALFDPTTDPSLSAPDIVDKTADLLAQNYYACVKNAAGTACLATADPVPEIPAALANRTAFSDAGLNVSQVDATKDAGDNKAYYVIERMCATAGPAANSNCNLSSTALGADAGTQHYEALTRPGDAYYRVTIRVEGPRNTVAYAQAILR